MYRLYADGAARVDDRSRVTGFQRSLGEVLGEVAPSGSLSAVPAPRIGVMNMDFIPAISVVVNDLIHNGEPDVAAALTWLHARKRSCPTSLA